MPTTILDKKQGAWTRRRHRVRQVLREALTNFLQEDSLMVSASIAYHSLLCIFPFLLVLFGLSGILIRHYEFGWRLAIILERYLPMNPDFILRNVVNISRAYGRLSFLSFVLLLWSSSGVFLPVEKALNRAWEVEKQRSWWRKRFLALEMAIIAGFLILFSSGLVGVNAHIHESMRRWALHGASSLFEFGYHIVFLGSTFGLTLAMFLVLFERLPNRPMRLSQIFPGALLTAIFWEAARSLFALLLPIFKYRQVYGSIGVVVALMTWAYLSAGVVLFGAQVSRALYRTLEFSSPIEATPAAPSPADPR